MQMNFSRPGAVDNPLTARESEILDLIAQGLTSKQIARQLSISPYTVNTHRDNLRRKLGGDWIKNVRGVGYKLVEAA